MENDPEFLAGVKCEIESVETAGNISVGTSFWRELCVAAQGLGQLVMSGCGTRTMVVLPSWSNKHRDCDAQEI